MLPKSLTSLQHPFIKYLVKLRKERSFRREEQKALVVGTKLIEDLIALPIKIETLLVETGYPIPPGIHTVTVSRDILKKITGVLNPEPLAAIIPLPPFQDTTKSTYLLVLDGISDPGNLGTLLRTALALGWDGVYLTENSCDPFNEKALRAAKGATFLLPIEEGTWQDFMRKSPSYHVILADMEGTPLNKLLLPTPLALILSKESQGARPEAKEKFNKVTIPIGTSMESLNVASAGSILLYSLRGSL